MEASADGPSRSWSRTTDTRRRRPSATPALLKNPNVVALFNTCGSPTTAAIASFVEKEGIPLLFPYADVPGAAATKTYFTLVPGNGDMVAAMASAAMKKMGPGSLYVITLPLPNVGESLKTIQSAVEAAGGKYLGAEEVALNAPDMNSVILKAKAEGADYIATIDATGDTDRIVNTMASLNAFPAKALLTSTSTATYSFLSGIDAGVDLSKVIATSVPAAGTDESAKSCVKAFQQYEPGLKADSLSLTGCANAQALVAALKAAGNDVSREGILKAIGGHWLTNAVPVLGPLAFKPGDHLGVASVHALTFENGQMKAAFNAPLMNR